MRVCGVEIKQNNMHLCLLEKNDGLISVLDCRQTRLQLSSDHLDKSIKNFYATVAKLVEDYQIEHFALIERIKRGKFAGSSTSFKIEALLQLIPQTSTSLVSKADIKDGLKRHPLAIDFTSTGLHKNLEDAFYAAFITLQKQ